MPFYNAERYLTTCLKSIMRQTHKALQVILIDDGSTDGSTAIACAFVQADRRFEILRQANQGQGAARNLGLSQATGEYVLFVDADDYLDKHCVEHLIASIGSDDIIQFGYRRIHRDGTRGYDHIPPHLYCYTAPWTRLYRRDFLERRRLRFPEGMIYEDVVFSAALWLRKPKQHIVPYVGYYYCEHEASTTFLRHREAEQRLYRELNFYRSGIRMRCLIAYTKLRLRLHFWMTSVTQDPNIHTI